MKVAQEWSIKSKYNSFNSYKGLTYFENYKKILAWLDGQGELPAPIEASLDPINACNNNCYYCNSQRYLRNEPAHLKRWGRDYMEDLLIDLASKGVKAFCWGGGGEATLNLRLAEMTRFGVSLGMECSIITNGVHMDDELMDALLLCRWIGISLDSAIPEVYRDIRGTDDCKKVLSNIEQLVRHKISGTDICVKVLILPETMDNLIYTCNVAKNLGVQDFHVRPVDLERKDYSGDRFDFDINELNDIFAELHEMETEDFHVYTVTHKYNEQFHVKHEFNRCLASPLVAQICTDKEYYVCVDHRLEDRFRIQEWGSDQHRELIKGIDPHTECARCTWSEYNKQMVAVENDTMCVNFP